MTRIRRRITKETNEHTFEAVSKQESNVSDLLKELEKMKIASNSTERQTLLENKDSKNNSEKKIEEKGILNQAKTDQFTKANQKLRTGILKPQGSLERAREEREQALLATTNSVSEQSLLSSSNSDISNNTSSGGNMERRLSDSSSTSTINGSTQKVVKKSRQNVAMQAILKKVEENSKQVKFDDTVGNEKNETKDSTNENKEDLSSKKGILSLKNHTGYPHLVETEHKKFADQRKPVNSTIESSLAAIKFTSNISYTQFSNTLPSNNTNYPLNQFSTVQSPAPLPSQQTTGNQFQSVANTNSYRNIPDFVPKPVNTFKPNNDLQQFYMKNQSTTNTGVPTLSKYPVMPNSQQTFDFFPSNQIQPPNIPSYSQNSFITQKSTNLMFSPPGNSAISGNPAHNTFQFNNQYPNLSTPTMMNHPNMFTGTDPVFCQHPYAIDEDKHRTLSPEFNNFENYSNKQQQMSPQNMSYFGLNTSNSYSSSKMSPWTNNIVDNKLPPMPPNGWWPNSQTQETAVAYDPYSLLSPQSLSPYDKYAPKMSLPEKNIGPGNIPPWTSHGPPPTPSNVLHQMSASQKYNQPINNEQALTMRQKILKENKKMYSKKQNEASLSSVNASDQFESVQNQSMSPPGYSLFSSNWMPAAGHMSMNSSPTVSQNNDPAATSLLGGQQSLFSGPGPSPLERLIEQQKQLRGTPQNK